MTMTRPPRSVRNFNPGNLEANATPWVGLADRSEMDADQRQEARFCVFKTPAYGFRALAVLLITYWHNYGLCTIEQIISRFAPTNENDTKSYIKVVCQSTGAEPNKVLDLLSRDVLASLCRAIAIHEAGGWFFDVKDLDKGVDMALQKENRLRIA